MAVYGNGSLSFESLVYSNFARATFLARTKRYLKDMVSSNLTDSDRKLEAWPVQYHPLSSYLSNDSHAIHTFIYVTARIFIQGCSMKKTLTLACAITTSLLFSQSAFAEFDYFKIDGSFKRFSVSAGWLHAAPQGNPNPLQNSTSINEALKLLK